jgi:hypothetical protein
VKERTALSSFFHKLLRAGGVLFLLCLCLFVWWRTALYHEINNRFKQLRAAGIPVSGTELNTWLRPVPDAENGALVLARAFDLVGNFPDNRSNEVASAAILARTNEWSLETRRLVEEYVQTNEAALSKAREALSFSRFRFPIDFSFWPETELPHLRQLKDLARTGALQAALAAEEGRADEWPEHVGFQLKMAATLESEPTTISQLVRYRILSMAAKVTERSLNRAIPNGAACSNLQTAFAQAGGTNPLPLALIGERAMAIPLFRLSWAEIQSRSQEDQQETQPRKLQSLSGIPAGPFWISGFFERDLNFYLETMDKSIALASLPPPKCLELTKHIDSAVNVAMEKHYILTGMLLGSSGITIRASTQAYIELAITALAVERFRHAQGRLPDDLKELAPQFLDAIPTDPFDGAALRYRRLTRGYVVYSVGQDGHDDGGREVPEHRKATDHSTYDITFTVER